MPPYVPLGWIVLTNLRTATGRARPAVTVAVALPVGAIVSVPLTTVLAFMVFARVPEKVRLL